MKLRATVRAGFVTALVVAAVGCVLPAPAVAAGPGRAFFGTMSWALPGVQDIAVMKRGRVGTLRGVFDGALEVSPDPAREAPYDGLMATAARERIEILPMLMSGERSRVGIKRPRTRAERTVWARFVSGVVARYGRGGTFWEAHPELDPMPLRAYQVWNEPNLPVFWRPTDDTAGYLRLVALTRKRVLAVDPKASIVLAGLPDSGHGTRMLDYLRAIYAQPGARTLFDVVALHPYSDDAPSVLEKLNLVRGLMDRRGDRRTPIWVTEIGWATGGPRSPFTTSRGGQAARFTRTFRGLMAARGRLRLGRIVVAFLQDRPYGASERPWGGPRTGLFDVAGRPKPAWAAFVGFTGGRPGGRVRNVARR